MRTKLSRGDAGRNSKQSNVEASQTSDLRVANYATLRAARPGPSAGKKRPLQDDKACGWVKGCKERGEWAELCFMARAAGLGMGVLKPFGESLRFDVGVLSGGKVWRVQVKSTIYCRRGN